LVFWWYFSNQGSIFLSFPYSPSLNDDLPDHCKPPFLPVAAAPAPAAAAVVVPESYASTPDAFDVSSSSYTSDANACA